jgi:integrase
MEETRWLLASLLYRAELRLLECLRLRSHDVDFAVNQLLVRDAKGRKNRVTTLPGTLAESLQRPISHHVRAIHERDLQKGGGEV